MNRMENIAIIPARSGSKGLINKNIKRLGNKPLLAYTIEAALASGIFSNVFVSTDSEEYASIAVAYGAEVPFLRSEQTAGDKASSWDVVRETLEEYKQRGKEFSMVALLQPTSPLRRAEDIINAYQLFGEKGANAVVSVCEADHSPLWCNTLPKDLSLEGFIRKEVSSMPRQELNSYYRINGGIYMVDVRYFTQTENLYTTGCYAYVMDKRRSVDIDDEFDFRIAESILAMPESL
ncbi:MAG: neuA [Herbinix sp.]|jgi:CMP-N,N'-diacetyllegionaminic acid synthase|nr:neuA [Herbinix sp.]